MLPLKELLPALLKASEWAEVTVEMGRFFAASCGTYLTTVTDLKDAEDAHIAILDGGIHQLTYAGQMMGMKVPRLSLPHRNGSKDTVKQHYMLCGSLCTTGDVLAFENVGAYTVTEGIGLFLSHALPSVYLYDEGREEGEALLLVRGPVPTSTLNSKQ